MARYWFAAFLLTALLAPIGTPQAAIITKCGASTGYTYYFGGETIPSGREGWNEEAIGESEIQLIQSGKELDIVFTDVRGAQSKKAQGFQVFSVPQPKPGFMLVVAIHQKGVLEHHLFQLDALGNGTVVWGSLKGSAWPIQKSSVYQATCRSP